MELVQCHFRGREKSPARYECSCPNLSAVDYRGVTAGQCAACPIPAMFGAARPALPAPQPPPREGPGTELKKLLAELGFATSETCACDSRAATMDAWGIAGCREHREEIVGWLQEQAAKQSWLNRIAGAVAAVRQAGVNPLDPYGSLLDEAIRRAEARNKEPPK